MEVYQKTITEAETIEILKKFLAGTDNSLTISQGEADTWMSVTMNSGAAVQELEHLLKRQEYYRQETIRLRQARANLMLLQSQMELRRFIEGQNLNPTNILSGLAFGLDVSADDLVKASGNLLEQVRKSWGLDEVESGGGS